MDNTVLISGKPNKTYRIAATDVAQGFTQARYVKDSTAAIGALITCEDNDIRFTFGTSTPTQGATGLGHVLHKDQSFKLNNPYAISTFKFLNKTNGSDGAIQVSFEFPIGG